MHNVTLGEVLPVMGSFGIHLDYTVRLKLRLLDQVDAEVLKEAIEKSWNQVFKSEDLSWDKDSVTGMLIDDEAKLKSGYFSTLSVSKFLYNPNTRTASYAGSDLQTVSCTMPPI